jgi:hypothetical protein
MGHPAGIVVEGQLNNDVKGIAVVVGIKPKPKL